MHLRRRYWTTASRSCQSRQHVGQPDLQVARIGTRPVCSAGSLPILLVINIYPCRADRDDDRMMWVSPPYRNATMMIRPCTPAGCRRKGIENGPGVVWTGGPIALAAITMGADQELALAIPGATREFEQDNTFSMAGMWHAPAAQVLDNRKPFLSE